MLKREKQFGVNHLRQKIILDLTEESFLMGFP
jgi:hypothetical protein